MTTGSKTSPFNARKFQVATKVEVAEPPSAYLGVHRQEMCACAQRQKCQTLGALEHDESNQVQAVLPLSTCFFILAF